MTNSDATEAKDQGDESPDPVGGFAFFLSLLLLLPAGFLMLSLALQQARETNLQTALTFLGCVIFGALLSQNLIRGHLSVLLHEFKHSLISNLVGNRYKGMRIDENSGDFQYAYTKKTAHYNAFISLAPYIVPIFSFLGCLISFATAQGNIFLSSIIMGLAYGTDLTLNIRDISPIQTDITEIRGGYAVGLAYILAWNLLIASVVLAWAFQGLDGITGLFGALGELFIWFYFVVVQGKPVD